MIDLNDDVYLDAYTAFFTKVANNGMSIHLGI